MIIDQSVTDLAVKLAWIVFDIVVAVVAIWGLVMIIGIAKH